ncbi:hypothetical protein Tco_1149998 [Tanacetum coccineum]
MENSKKGNLPLHHGIKISKDLCLKTDKELDRMSRVPYASVNPGEGHWTDVHNILKYLRNTKDRFLVYGREEELKVTGYCDASWQKDKDDSHSQSGWVFLLNGDLGVIPIVQDPIEIFCDNKSAVSLTKEPNDHGKSKHIERKYHFVRSKVKEGHFIMKHIRSEDNPVDPFTKALAKSRHDEHARSIGLKDNFGLLACKPFDVPLEQNLKISNEPTASDPVINRITKYQKLIGKLIYLTHAKPDISYVIHYLSQFMHKPLKSHLKISLKVLRYLKGSPGKGVHNVRCLKVSLETFEDAD